MDGPRRSVISLRNVSKRFEREYALRDVSLDVPRGLFTGVIGPGASGKTVLVKVIAGLIKPDEGEVIVEGADIARLGELALQKVRSRIGMLFQNNALFDYMSVGENIAFPLRRLMALGEDDIAARVAERLERMGLPGMEDRTPASLSGGQRKRVGVARSTVAGQPIIIYDDPTAGLDPVTASRIFLLLREEQKKSGGTAIAISSDVDSLVKYIDHVVIMNRGEAVYAEALEMAYEAAHPFARAFIRGEWRAA